MQVEWLRKALQNLDDEAAYLAQHNPAAARDFVAAVQVAGKAAELIEAPEYNHFDLSYSLGNPYGPNGRAALALMGLR